MNFCHADFFSQFSKEVWTAIFRAISNEMNSMIRKQNMAQFTIFPHCTQKRFYSRHFCNSNIPVRRLFSMISKIFQRFFSMIFGSTLELIGRFSPLCRSFRRRCHSFFYNSVAALIFLFWGSAAPPGRACLRIFFSPYFSL